jgi:protein-L-isoaspartate(D-aspartate) O-methyltransferase
MPLLSPKAVDAHHALLDYMIARGALWSPALMAAFRATPRQLFLDRLWCPREGRWRVVDPADPAAEDLALIYSDRAITTRLSDAPEGEVGAAVSSSSQPSLMAQMLEDLELRPGLKVLEVGAGTGYNAALIAYVVGRVTSIDVDQDVLRDALRHLDALPDRDVLLVYGDGRLGYQDGAPFDRIQMAAATDDLEPAWLGQLAPGGIVQVPLDLGPGMAWVLQGTADAGFFEGRLTRAAFFMPLRDEGNPGRDRNVPSGPLPGPERLQGTPAPWSAWHEGRSTGGADYLTSLALMGWLEGWTVGHANCPDGRPGYGLGDLVRGEVCWMGPYEWRVSGKGGLEMGRRLWRRWLDLGGPRPQEWRVRAAPRGGKLEADAAARVSYARQGRCCDQVWEIVEPRRRVDLE